jgi:uncharacterized protein YabE (DUF348 family)
MIKKAKIVFANNGGKVTHIWIKSK